MKNRLLLFLIGILGWTACEPQTTETEVNPVFLTFSFDKAYNEVFYHHFSSPVTYTVTNAQGKSQTYTVSLTVATGLTPEEIQAL